MAEEDSNSLEQTSTWIVAVVCFIFVLISLAAERALHRLGKCLKRKGQESLFEALQKIKAELMLLGFISLLLTVFQGFINDMCIPTHFASFMLPCRKENDGQEGNTHGKYAFQPSWSKRRLLAEGGNNCAKKGKAQFMSLEALHQLHIFIFVLAAVYVVFCAATMILGGLQVQGWKDWEDSVHPGFLKPRIGAKQSTRIKQMLSQHHHKFFKQRKGHSTIIGVMTSFFKQLYGSVSKSDYIALRHGFIMTHFPKNLSFDFHKYMLRTLEHDFKKVVGISWYLWLFVVIFLLINLEGWHAYFWMSFLPLILLLIVGTKLEHIIKSLADEIEEKKKDNNQIHNKPEGTDEERPWVTPSDKHFWFGRPIIFLYLIHFILFQNAFEVAFFLWVGFTYGIHSCILDSAGFIIPRLVIGIIVQVLCSYSTLPLYTIVTLMGSQFKRGIFEKEVHELVDSWHENAVDARGHESSHRVEMQNLAPELREIVSAADESVCSVEGFTTPHIASQHCSS